MMKKIECITLQIYKQHYRDVYSKPLKCDYSTWGYFDGISGRNIMNYCKEWKRIEREDVNPFAYLWFGMEKAATNLEGNAGVQTIGIFRECNEDDRCDEFDKSSFAYIGLCFVQIRSETDEVEFVKTLEKRHSFKEHKDQGKVFYYHTLDNASIVVLAFSNSLSTLEQRLLDVLNDNNVKYDYTIYGVSEKYLADASGYETIKKMGVNEQIHNLTFHFSYDGSNETQEAVIRLIDEWGEKEGENNPANGFKDRSFYGGCGRSRLDVIIPESNVMTLIDIMKEDGLVTHQSKLYEINGVYGIETTFSLGTCKHKRSASHHDKNNDNGSTGWSEYLLEKYKNLAEKYISINNEGRYSTCMAMIRTLNALSQYENNEIRKSLFYVIYPAVRKFDRLLDEAIKYSHDDQPIKEGIKEFALNTRKAIGERLPEFLDNINDTLYHTLHAEQTCFMMPGCNGISYSVSQKMLIFYNWYCLMLNRVLCDEGEDKYWVLTLPMLEGSTSADYYSFHTKIRERLIYIRISQRVMLFPKSAMLILCHEVGHYIGEKSRKRDRRTHLFESCICELLVECMWALNDKSEINADIEKIINEMKIASSYIFLGKIKKYTHSKKKDDFFKTITPMYVSAAKQIMLDDKYSLIYGIIRNKENNILKEVADNKERQNLISKTIDIAENNAKCFLSNDKLDKMIMDLMEMFKEVYADCTAYTILEFDLDDFYDAVALSEGMQIEDAEHAGSINFRRYVLGRIDSEEIEIKGKDKFNQRNMISEHIYMRTDIKEFILAYARECRLDLKEYLDRNKERIDKIRGIYKLFADEKNNGMEAYLEIRKACRDFEQEIKRIHVDDPNKIASIKSNNKSKIAKTQGGSIANRNE